MKDPKTIFVAAGATGVTTMLAVLSQIDWAALFASLF